MINLKVYQFELCGFDAGTSDTDQLIKWVAAPSQIKAETAMKSFDLNWQMVNEIDLPPDVLGIDLIILESLFDI